MELNPFDFDEFLWAMKEEPLVLAIEDAFKNAAATFMRNRPRQTWQIINRIGAHAFKGF